MAKVVADSIRNAEFQELKSGALAILFFKESCPYCRDFKPTWNKVAKNLQKRWSQDSLDLSSNEDSDDDHSSYRRDKQVKKSSAPPVKKIDVFKFPAIQKRIGFPTVPTIALYKGAKPAVFLTTQDRSLPNILKLVENYYKYNILPPKGEFLVADEQGRFPVPKQDEDVKQDTQSRTQAQFNAKEQKEQKLHIEPKEQRELKEPKEKTPYSGSAHEKAAPSQYPKLSVKLPPPPHMHPRTLKSPTTDTAAAAASAQSHHTERTGAKAQENVDEKADELFARLMAKLMKGNI